MMRRLPIVLFIAIAACSAPQELAPIPTVEPTSPSSQPSTTTSTTSTTPLTTTTTLVETTTTSTMLPLLALQYEEVVDLAFPIQMVAEPGSDISYIATKDGRVWAFDGDGLGEPVLDIRGRVRNRGEQGLLSIALGSDRLFVHYSAGDGDTVVSEFPLEADGSADPDSERVLLRLGQPAANHNGGMIQFGPDGRLYVGLGDGGGGGDRFGNGQNRDTLLGGLVAIDVVTGESELFQYGLRNPWRFWIEGDNVFIADVGQNAFEEVSFSPLVADVNYGWPITEGLHCFKPASDCDTAGVTLPVIEMAHGDERTCSISGGVVYGGTSIPEIAGQFFYSDFCGGYLRSVTSGGEVTGWTDDVGVLKNVVGFGVDGDSEMYVLTTEQVLKVTAVRG